MKFEGQITANLPAIDLACTASFYQNLGFDLFGVFYGLIVVGWQCDVALVTRTKFRIATHEI